jgi:hypothetical protein
MAVVTSSTSVGTTVVQILGAQAFSIPGAAPVVISNLGTNPVFVGGGNVTATTGVQIAAGANLVLPATDPAGLWAIAATGTNNVVVGVF